MNVYEQMALEVQNIVISIHKNLVEKAPITPRKTLFALFQSKEHKYYAGIEVLGEGYKINIFSADEEKRILASRPVDLFSDFLNRFYVIPPPEDRTERVTVKLALNDTKGKEVTADFLDTLRLNVHFVIRVAMTDIMSKVDDKFIRTMTLNIKDELRKQ